MSATRSSGHTKACRLRLLLSRDCSAPAPLRARLHRAGYPARSPGLRHRQPGDRVTQQARNVSSELSERTISAEFLIRDRDAKFPRSFEDVFRADRIRIVKTTIRHRVPCRLRTGDWHPCAVSVSTGYWSSVVVISRRSGSRFLQRRPAALAEYLQHYNAWPHRSLGQRCPRSAVHALR
jgi:hypothetical protein